MPQPRPAFSTWLLLGVLAALSMRGTATAETCAEDAATAAAHASAHAVARALPAVVTIRAFGTGGEGYGAGLIVRPDGHVLTALHVVEGAAAFAVVTRDGTEYPGSVVGTDTSTDLALLKVLAPGVVFPAVVFGRDDGVEIGEPVLAISNPFGVGTSVSRGVLSARGRRGVVPDNDAPLLQTDAAINPGSSGGALINVHGEVIGLITAILTRTGGHQGVGFAVPSRELERVLPYLFRGERPLRPWIGVRVVQDADGLRVRAVIEGGPAEEAGLRAGDVLEELERHPLRRAEALRDAAEEAGIGGRLELTLTRGTRSLDLEIVVGAR